MYRYYATKHPLTNKTSVSPTHNKIVSFATFPEPRLIKAANRKNPDFTAYGYIDYEWPLTDQELSAYGLFSEFEYLIDNQDVFRIVHFMPSLEIWNIGKSMPDGYLPFCRLALNQPFPGGRQVDTNYLLAVKTPYAQKIVQAADIMHERRISNLEKAMENYLKSGKREHRVFFKRSWI